jgi:hypothetical protein
MASDLTVQTIRGPGSGVNANQILIPTGQKIVAQSGGIIVPNITLQYVQQAFTTFEETTATNYVDSLISINITTTRDNSKIFYNGAIGWNPASAGRYLKYRLLRNGTEIYSPGRISPDAEGGEDSDHIGYIGYIDSPSVVAGTTLTYKIQYYSQQNFGAVRINDNLKTNVILMEIAQ